MTAKTFNKTSASKTKRYCTACGKAGPFVTSQSVKCKPCTQVAAEERKKYQREYQAARSRAVSRLIDDERDKYLDLLHDETSKSEYLQRVALKTSAP